MNRHHLPLLFLLLFLSSCKTNREARPEEDGKEDSPQEQYYDQSAGMQILDTLGKVYGNPPQIAGLSIETPNCPNFIKGIYFDKDMLVFQVSGDTTKVREVLEKASGSGRFRLESTHSIEYSQRELRDIQNELSKRFMELEDRSVKDNVTGFGTGLYHIDIHLIMNTPEKQKEFRQKIMDSPAFRFHGPETPGVNEETGVNDTLGIYLRPEYAVYSTTAHQATFILYNNSGISIECGEHYFITYQDENGVWRDLPINYTAIDIAYNIRPKGSHSFTASLYPHVHPNRPGRYRFFYHVHIAQRKILMMTEFRLSDQEQEWKQIPKTPIPPEMMQDASEQQIRMLEKEQDEATYEVAEIMPEFPGGMSALLKYLTDSLKYRKAPDGNGRKGTVVIQVIIDKDGSVTEPVILRHLSPELDKEALRVVNSMPKWKPGSQSGRVVKVKYTFPITFILPKSDEGGK